MLPGSTTSQVMAGALPLPMPETAAGEAESILVSNRPSVMISFNQRLIEYCADSPVVEAVLVNVKVDSLPLRAVH